MAHGFSLPLVRCSSLAQRERCWWGEAVNIAAELGWGHDAGDVSNVTFASGE